MNNIDRAFEQVLKKHDLEPLRRGQVTTLQLNVGNLCNMHCIHCHVGAGPGGSKRLEPKTAARVIEILENSPAVRVLDITGGAPELNPNFRFLVTRARAVGREVIDRCNLTVLLKPGQEGLAEFLAANKVHIVASMPCYLASNVDQQRGGGAHEKCIVALKMLNALGYGRPGTGLVLDLVYNPAGAFLPPAQDKLQKAYRDELGREFGVVFDNLLTITNMPINRFARWLKTEGKYDAYLQLLKSNFNRATTSKLMCRELVSVSWDGALFDCDFNQVLGLKRSRRTVWDIDSLLDLEQSEVLTAAHCFGCTAGAGSSCSGALD